MSQKLIVGNLPADVTVEEIAGVLGEAGVENPVITLNKEGNPDKIAAVLVIEDADRATMDRIAKRVNGMQYRGRTLTAYVPLFM